MLDIYNNGRFSRDEDLFLLRKYCNYNCDLAKSHELSPHFVYHNKEIIELLDYIPADLLINSSVCDFSHMVKVMVWVHKTLISGSDAVPVRPFNCINILKKTLSNQIRANCWMHAVVLNEILLSLGYKSKMIRCMPFDIRFTDCHCVVQVYSNQYRKWILLDPSFGSYYVNRQWNPINLREFRESIIYGETVVAALISSKKADQVMNYWIKNLFRFETYATSEFNAESVDGKRIVYSLLPNGYELLNKEYESHGRLIQCIHTHNAKAFWEE